VDRDDAPSDDERSIPQPTMAERISAQRPKRALIQLAVVDAHGRRRSGVPIVVKRATEGRHDTEETATTDAFGNATIWLSDIREAEMLTFAVAGQPETTIPADAIDAETLVSLSLPLRADAPLKGSLAEQIRPRREYSPPLARILSAEEQYVTVPNTAGCNVPVPATQASSDFLIYQLVRRPQDGAVKRADLDAIKPIDAGNESLKVPTGVRFGDRVIFRQTWRLLGQSLGDLVYSLPLAPLESVNLAIVEWSRQDAAQRVESTTATESLLHAQFRDRSVVETVATAISEYQGGFSVIGAAAGLGGPAVGAIGGGTSHTWGNRNLVGESVQQLSDAVQQASELVRSQNSTVVVQASQAERDALQTRTVSNYNQNHALTIQYYEVLRHFEVITAFEAVEPVLLVPFFSIRFDRETALRFRRILERNALDPRLSDWLGASERLGYSGNYPAPPPPPDQDDGAAGAAPAPRLIERLQIRYITGDQTTVGYVKLELGLRSGAWIWADDIFARGIGQSPVLEQNTEYVRDAPDGDATGLDVSTIEQVRVSWTQNGLPDGWKFKGIEIRYGVEGGSGLESVPLFTQTAVDALRHFTGGGTKSWTSALFTAPQPAASGQPAPGRSISARTATTQPTTLAGRLGITNVLNSTRLTGILRRAGVGGPLSPATMLGTNAVHQQRRHEDDAALEMLLLEHLNANRLPYSRAVMLEMDGDERVRLLEAVLGDTDLLRDIGFIPVGVSGHYLAFPYSGDRAPTLDGALVQQVKRVRPQARHVNLPTRGVFAETHLSHCPAREERDPSRMYSPSETILPTAPAISGVQPGSRNAPTDTTPTLLPSPVVNIQNPAPAPDPAGLAAAFGLLGQMGPFRDMSTSREVSSLLGQLASGAISGAGVAPAAQRVQQALLSGGANPSGNGYAAHPAVSGSPQEIFDRMKLLDQSALPGSVRDRIRENILDPGAASNVIDAGRSLGTRRQDSRVVKEGSDVARAVIQLLNDPVFDAPVQNRFGQNFQLSTGDFVGDRLVLWPRASAIWYLENDRILEDSPQALFQKLEFEAVELKIERMQWLRTMAQIEANFLIAFTCPLAAILGAKGVGLLAKFADPDARQAAMTGIPKVVAGFAWMRQNAPDCLGCIVKNAAVEAVKSIPQGFDVADVAYIIGRALFSGRNAAVATSTDLALTSLRQIAKAMLITSAITSSVRAAGAAVGGLAPHALDLIGALQSEGIANDAAPPCVELCLTQLLSMSGSEDELQKLGEGLTELVPVMSEIFTDLTGGVEL